MTSYVIWQLWLQNATLSQNKYSVIFGQPVLQSMSPEPFSSCKESWSLSPSVLARGQDEQTYSVHSLMGWRSWLQTGEWGGGGGTGEDMNNVLNKRKQQKRESSLSQINRQIINLHAREKNVIKNKTKPNLIYVLMPKHNRRCFDHLLPIRFLVCFIVSHLERRCGKPMQGWGRNVINIHSLVNFHCHIKAL